MNQEKNLIEWRLKSAEWLSTSQFIPKDFQNHTGNVLLIMNLAARLGVSELWLMENCEVRAKRLYWNTDFVIELIKHMGELEGGLS